MLLASALTCLLIALSIGRELGFFTDRFIYVRQYAAMLRLVDEHYIGQYEVDEINTSAMRSAVFSLDDRWSYYMTQDELEIRQTRTNNSYAGIGVIVANDKDYGGMLIRSVHRDSAAETAGIVAGDLVTGIDGVDVTDYDLDEIFELLTRPVGSTVLLEIIRENGSVEEVSVVYSIIYVDPVSYEMFDDNIGYIAISNFNNGAANGFIAATEYLIGQGAQTFVFDVRDNGGGILYEMTDILEHLIPEGEIFIAVDKSGIEQIIYSSGPGLVGYPSVVLVDRDTYSAAEYFAAILREYDYALIVGEQTSGKSRSQQTFRLPGGGALSISSAQYLTKNRVSLHDAGGLTPDYLISLTDDELDLFYAGDLTGSADPQLNMAIALLTKQ